MLKSAKLLLVNKRDVLIAFFFFFMVTMFNEIQ